MQSLSESHLILQPFVVWWLSKSGFSTDFACWKPLGKVEMVITWPWDAAAIIKIHAGCRVFFILIMWLLGCWDGHKCKDWSSVAFFSTFVILDGFYMKDCISRITYVICVGRVLRYLHYSFYLCIMLLVCFMY